MSAIITKPTSDKEYLEYQKNVCIAKKCKWCFDLKRGIFKKGCMPVDLYAMFGSVSNIIRDDGECICFAV